MAKPNPDSPAPLPGEDRNAAGNPAARKRGKKGLVIGTLIMLIALAGGGGAAYWKWGLATPAQAAGTAEHAPVADEEPGMVPFEPFLVNLADDGGQAYLRVTLNLLVATDEQAKVLEGKPVTRTRIRSAVLEVLSTQTASQLVTPEGKTELKRAIAEKIQSLKLNTEVRDVLFSDFVVQQ